jgi:type IV secretion system protein VirB1
VPNAALTTLQAIVQTESGGNPNAMQIDFPHALLKTWGLAPGSLRLKRQPADRAEALRWLSFFESYNVSVDIGLMQVSTADAERRGVLPESLLDPCINLRVGWQILSDAYAMEVKASGPGQTALNRAISRYNTGSPRRGIDNGYLFRVIAAAQRFDASQKSRDKVPAK